MSYRDGWAGVPPRRDPISGELAPPLELEPPASTTVNGYIPECAVVSDGYGHYLGIRVCDCYDGSVHRYHWTPSPDCPIHGELPDWGTDD